MMKSGICLEGVNKQNALFFEKYASKNASMPPMSRIDPDIIYEIDIYEGRCCAQNLHQYHHTL